jgi:hypothetical protein
MPDDDRIPRSLTGAWRRVLRSLQGRQPADRTASTVVSALAATLRSVHGVPELPGIAAQMQDAARAGLVTGSWMPASVAARRHIPTRVAERAAAALVATLRDKLALVSPDRAVTMLAERVVRDLAYAYGLDRMAPVLLAEGRYGPAELQGHLAEIVADDRISNLAKRLLARPDAAGLRAPSQRRPRMTLRDLTYADVEAL